LERYGAGPLETEAASLRRVAEALNGHAHGLAREVLTRMVYAAGDPGLASFVRIHPDAVNAATAALRDGKPVITDVRMVQAALDRARLVHFDSSVRCAVDAAPEELPAPGLTRTAAGMVALADGTDGAIFVVGNAPTALLALLDLVDAGRATPALIVGTPVGFVAAAEAKAELETRRVPFVTVAGTRGGSAIAAAAFNAMLRIAGGESVP
jgi:precorrin-8X/cobalt-precorrin-8 methylmutase